MKTIFQRALYVLAPLTVAAATFAAVLATAPVFAAPDAPNSATIIADFGDGSSITRRIVFTPTQISGQQALQLAFPVEVNSGAICKINNTGCPASNCFCAGNNYWGYYHRNISGSWDFSNVGAATYSVTNGAVEGWVWSGSEAQPAQISLPALAAFSAVDWLRTQQKPDGGFGGVGVTLDGLIALRAAGVDATSFKNSAGRTPLDALRSNTQTLRFAADAPANAGKMVFGLAAADIDPISFANANFVLSVTQNYSASSGAYGPTNWDQTFSMLALAAVGEAIPVTATQLLASRVYTDGGWGYVPGSSDIDTTGLALQALAAAGQSPTSTLVLDAVQYLDSKQNSDGGFPYESPSAFGTASNANSTALAVQGLIAATADPYGGVFTTISNTTPISYLLAQQQPDGGLIYLTPPSNLLATLQSIPALLGRPLPFRSRAVETRKTVLFIKTQQKANGGFEGFGAGSTLDAVIALGAAGTNPGTLKSSTDKTPLDFMLTLSGSITKTSSVAFMGKLSTALVAVDASPRAYAGMNLAISLTQRYSATTGLYGSSVWDQAWAMIGLRAAGDNVPLNAITALSNTQATGGGWGFAQNDSAADPDSTGLALQALAAAGTPREHPAVQAGLAYLRRTQLVDGGFNGFDSMLSPSSTGLVLQGLAAFGEMARGPAWQTNTRPTVKNALDALLDTQNNTGAFPGFAGPNDPDATYQALGGILGKPYFIQKPPIVWLPLAIRK